MVTLGSPIPQNPWWGLGHGHPGVKAGTTLCSWESAEGGFLLLSRHSAASQGQGWSLLCSMHFWKGFSDSFLSVWGSAQRGPPGTGGPA